MENFKIDMIVWSKNRACQLDLLLRSTKEHFKNIGVVHIIWKADDDKYLAGYKKIMSNHYGLNIKFIQEQNFEDDVKTILSKEIQSEYVLGNSDDNVFIRTVNIVMFQGSFMGLEFWEFELGKNIVAFSLRLGKSINYCLPANLELKLPIFIRDNIFLVWDWTKSDPRGGWGYPHPCDSHIYNRQYWIDLVKDGTFSNPKELEDYMNNHRNTSCPYMTSFREPHLVSISANELRQGSHLVNMGIALEELNEKFLKNYVISTENIYGLDASSCHVLLNYEWVKE